MRETARDLGTLVTMRWIYGSMDLRLADIATLLAVRHVGSLSAAARDLKVTPSQVSKAIDRLESSLGQKLLERVGRGVQLSDAAHRIAPMLEEILERVATLRGGDEGGQPLAVAAPSYLLASFLVPIARSQTERRVRGVEMPPGLVRAYAAASFFDVTFTIGHERLPAPWVSSEVGAMRKALFTSPRLAAALGKKSIPVDKLRDLPFVSAVYHSGGQFVPVDDDCPLKRGERRLGHEAQTIAMALELAAHCDQLVFGPKVAARELLDRKLLVELDVQGWDIREPLILACHGDRVKASTQRKLLETLRERLNQIDPV
jgi:DNA-binding transcriptional LysR family regulator